MEGMGLLSLAARPEPDRLGAIVTGPSGSARSQPRVTAPETSFDRVTLLSDERLLRGVPVTRLLLRRDLLSDSPGTAGSYQLSQRVSIIDVFISHNWNSPAAQKFKALALYFNLGPAMCVVAAYTLALTAMTALGILPSIKVHPDTDVFEYRLRPYCVLSGPILFWATLFRCRDFSKLCTMGSETTVFLDKCCIHQCDVARKEKGIQSLGAFLRHSNMLLIMFSETYLQRLWTVYELASFMTLHPSKLPRVVLLGLPDVILISNLLYWLSLLLHVALHSRLVAEALAEHGLTNASWLLKNILMMSAIVILSHCDRGWQLELRRAKELAAAFSVRHAKCFDERDRPFLYKNIAHFMRSLGLVAPSAGQGEALEQFDALVHRRVPRAVQASAGRASIHYRYVMVVFMPGFLLAMDFLAAMAENRRSRRVLLIYGIFLFNHVFAMLPLTMGLMSWLNQRVLCLRAGAVHTAVGVLAWALLKGSLLSLNELRLRARGSDLHLGLFASTSAGFCFLTWLVYRPLRGNVAAHEQREAELANTSSGSTSESEESLPSRGRG